MIRPETTRKQGHGSPPPTQTRNRGQTSSGCRNPAGACCFVAHSSYRRTLLFKRRAGTELSSRFPAPAARGHKHQYPTRRTTFWVSWDFGVRRTSAIDSRPTREGKLTLYPTPNTSAVSRPQRRAPPNQTGRRSHLVLCEATASERIWHVGLPRSRRFPRSGGKCPGKFYAPLRTPRGSDQERAPTYGTRLPGRHLGTPDRILRLKH